SRPAPSAAGSPPGCCPCSGTGGAPGAELNIGLPVGALVGGELATPVEGLWPDLRKAPTDQLAAFQLAKLHDVGALPAADHAEIALRHRIGPLNVPGVKPGIIGAQRRAVDVDVALGVTQAPGTPRRHDPDVLNGAAFENPAEVPFARPPSPCSVWQIAGDIEIPGADQPGIKIHVGPTIGGGAAGLERRQEGRCGLGHGGFLKAWPE